MMPLSVIIAVINALSVTSKAGLNTLIFFSAIGSLKNSSVTSLSLRCSIGILLPDFMERSKVDAGAATKKGTL